MTKRTGNNSRPQAAFTLVEMMLVLVLTALVCSWATYRFYSQSKRAVLQRAGYSIYHALRQARTMACREHRLCVFEMDFTNQTFLIRSLQGDIPVAAVPETSETPEKTEQVSELEKNVRLPEPVRFHQLLLPNQSPLKTGVQQISFSPQGYASAAVIQIRSEDQTVSVRVYPQTAKVELLRGSVDSLPTDCVEAQSMQQTFSEIKTP